MLLSSQDGWPQDYTVETNNGSDWIMREEVTGYNNALRLIVFPGSLNVSRLRINVTNTVNSGYTRINEVYPLIESSVSDTTVLNVSTSSRQASASSTARPSFSADPSIPSKKPDIGAIVVGVCGVVGLIIFIFVIILGLLQPTTQKKKTKNVRSNDPPNSSHSQHEAPTELIVGITRLMDGAMMGRIFSIIARKTLKAQIFYLVKQK